MAYFLALDVGGTKTEYALADESRTLARVRTGTVKRMRVDAGIALQHLELGLRQLEEQAGISLRQVARTCVGTAGETVPLVTDFLRTELAARAGGGLLLLGDVEIALDAAFRKGACVLVMAGTGSNVAGRTRGGRLMTAGGHGPVLADQGSGYRIGVQALRALCLARDEERPTTLLEAVLGAWRLHSFEELVDIANRVPGPDFASLVQDVLRCATQGDAVAQEVLRREGQKLGSLVCVLMQRLLQDVAEHDSRMALAFAGSILERVAPVREALMNAVHARFPDVELRPGVVDPMEGALWRARTGYGFVD
jgi:glucosamine kinase